jgi:hypothetical protein
MAAGLSDYTEEKQRVLATVLAAHMGAAKSIIARHHAYPRYVFVDLNAGPGYDRQGCEGSPAIALRVAGEVGLPMDAWLCERDASTLRMLRAHFGTHPGAHILAGDHDETHRQIVTSYRGRPPVYGLVYSDPNAAVLPVEALAALTTGTLARVDILAHINANGGYKRTRSAHPDRYLADDLEKLGKRYMWVRREIGPWQWTFVIASNWGGFPAFKNRGVVPVDSDEGATILDRLNYSRNERRRSLQSPLPFLTSDHIAPTPSTWPTRDSAPYAALSWSGPLGAASDAPSDVQPKSTT